MTQADRAYREALALLRPAELAPILVKRASAHHALGDPARAALDAAAALILLGLGDGSSASLLDEAHRVRVEALLALGGLEEAHVACKAARRPSLSALLKRIAALLPSDEAQKLYVTYKMNKAASRRAKPTSTPWPK